MTHPNEEANLLRAEIRADRAAYYEGTPRCSDEQFDAKIARMELISPDDEVLNEVGAEVVDENRKRTLPVPMRSMHKTMTVAEVHKWLRKYGVPLDAVLCGSPKLDGISGLHDEDKNKDGFTRGDGTVGSEINAHIKLVKGYVAEKRPILTFGEIIMPNANFAKYAEEGDANPRNTVGGFLGNDKANEEELADCSYIRYGLASPHDYATKHEVLDFLNSFQPVTIPYQLLRADELTEESLKALFKDWSVEYALDGIILELDEIKYHTQLGRERNGNPAYARAYKGGDLEERGTSTVTGITYRTSKQGNGIPTIQIKPLSLDGVTVTNITGNNARYLVDMGIQTGVEVVVKRSGMVIPKIIGVHNPAAQVELPTHCSCGTAFQWGKPDKKGRAVHLICPSVECPSQALMRIISFFSILEVEDVSKGVLTQFYDAGYDSIAKILAMTAADMEKLDRFGKRKAEKSYNAIQSKLTGIPLAKLQHASGFFRILGSKKLALLQHFADVPTKEEVCKINGFSDISAQAYIDGLPKFQDFIKDLPLTYKVVEKKVVTEGTLLGKSFVFTGFRNVVFEQDIEKHGGVMANSISKTTTYLVVKESGTGSAKEKKAQKLGVVILEIKDLEALLYAS